MHFKFYDLFKLHFSYQNVSFAIPDWNYYKNTNGVSSRHNNSNHYNFSYNYIRNIKIG